MSHSVIDLLSVLEASVESEAENLCVADNIQRNILKLPTYETYKFVLCEFRNGRKTQRRKSIKYQTIVTANNPGNISIHNN